MTGEKEESGVEEVNPEEVVEPTSEDMNISPPEIVSADDLLTDGQGCPIVVFKAKDMFSIGVINYWLEKATEAGIGSHKLVGMTRVRNEFARWQQENNDQLKRPD